MPDLETALREQDDSLLPALAQVWGVDTTNKKDDAIIKALHETMLQAERAEKIWDALDDPARGALQMLMASGLSMQAKKFERAFGEIRKMGRGAIEREMPHKTPANVAETLYYRGFVSIAYEQGKSGIQPVVFVPNDLAELLPVHKTSYANLESEPLAPQQAMTAEQLEPIEEDMLENILVANTSIVDDMTTLLAYLRIQGAGVEGDQFLPVDGEGLQPFLLAPGDIRLNFLLGIGISADLITTQEGRAYPKRSGLQNWLSLPRSEQILTFLDAWKTSSVYHDMWHVPGLHPDPDAGFPYDPLLGRDALLEFLAQLVPEQAWWSIDDFIESVKAIDPDFQRPAGDYDSWYIRNNTGEYLVGFESWDAVDGALLEYYIRGPMYWLGLVDLAEDAARLTAYGRAFIGATDWPNPPEASDNVEIGDDGTLKVSRKVARLDRFQVARFSTWLESGDTYIYRLDADGIERAAAQGITTHHIAAFLKRQLNDQPLPKNVARLLETWQSGATAKVTFQRLLVLRTTSPETLERIYNEPAFRRYLGARLGPMACVILEGQESNLQVALGEIGVSVEIM